MFHFLWQPTDPLRSLFRMWEVEWLNSRIVSLELSWYYKRFVIILLYLLLMSCKSLTQKFTKLIRFLIKSYKYVRLIYLLTLSNYLAISNIPLYWEKCTYFMNKRIEIFEFSSWLGNFVKQMISSILDCTILRCTNSLNSLILTGRQTLVFTLVLSCFISTVTLAS